MYRNPTADPGAVYLDIPYSTIVETVLNSHKLQLKADAKKAQGKRTWDQIDYSVIEDYNSAKDAERVAIKAKSVANKSTKRSQSQEAGPSQRAQSNAEPQDSE